MLVITGGSGSLYIHIYTPLSWSVGWSIRSWIATIPVVALRFLRSQGPVSTLNNFTFWCQRKEFASLLNCRHLVQENSRRKKNDVWGLIVWFDSIDWFKEKKSGKSHDLHGKIYGFRLRVSHDSVVSRRWFMGNHHLDLGTLASTPMKIEKSCNPFYYSLEG